jgi:predicted amidohydrolase
VRIALLQLDLAWEDPPENRARALRRLEEAAARGARLAILPEMFATGYSMRAEEIAEPEEGPTESFLREAAVRLGLFVLAGVAQRAEPLPENRVLLARPDGSVERIAKLHPFTFAGEEKVFGAGDRVATFDVEGIRVTPLVCYDLRFPEPFRMAAERTHLFAVVANWPERRRAHWSTLLAARAIENLAYVAGVNRVGEGNGLVYTGDSALFSPWGETLLSAAGQEALLVGDVRAEEVSSARERFPALSDRRPGAYRLAP